MAFDAQRIVQGFFRRQEARHVNPPRLPDLENTPAFVRSAMGQWDRQLTIERPRRSTADSARALLHLHRRLGATGEGYASRRLAESRLADYLESKVLPTPEGLAFRKLPSLIESLRTCRCHGVYGMTPAGKPVIMWDKKCESALLCPDEARVEQQRMVARYVPELLKLKEQGFRIYKAVLTFPNFERGKLRYGMRTMFRRLRALQRARRHGAALFPEIRGILAIEESPLSRLRDWNVHLNVIFVVNGWLDYEKLRRFWYWNLEIIDESKMRALTVARLQAKGVNVADLSAARIFESAFSEIVKYPIQTIPEKNPASGDGDASESHLLTRAPAMVEWPPEAWCEWYKAHTGFRRTRSYGCLYRLGEPESEHTDLEAVEWIGSVTFTSKGTYDFSIPWLGSIRVGDNFASQNRIRGRNTGPPEEFSDQEVAEFQATANRAFENYYRSA
ncbi:MAG: hypothetical protein WBR15_10900 [Gammaproteobacteria bacterium]